MSRLKNKLKKLLKNLVIITIFIITIFPVITIAEEPPAGGIEPPEDLRGIIINEMKPIKRVYGYPGEPPDPRAVVAVIIRIFMQLLAIIFLILVIYSGFVWMTAGGDEEKVIKAKNILKRGTIGLAIIFMAYSIAHFAAMALSCSVDPFRSWCLFLNQF